MKATFWFTAGALTGAMATVLVYFVIDSRATAESGRAAPHPVTGASATGAATATGTRAPPMEEATARLAARLERDGGSANDWQLLAQSYEFLGRSADASRARAHATTAPTQPDSVVAPGPGTADASMPSEAEVARQASLLSQQLQTSAAGTAAPAEPTASTRAAWPTP
jgi:hypothetical protein